MSDMPAGVAFRAAGPLEPLQRAAMWTAGLAGWRRHTAALLLGALAAAPFSPVGATPLLVILLSGPPVLVISFSGLVWLMDGCTGRGDAALLGWSFGFGFFLAGLYWISAALFVDIAQFWWLVPLALLGFPAGFALFTLLAVLVAYEATRRFALLGAARILVLAVSWVMAEWLRGHILTGFPWNLIGYAWAGAFPGGLAVLQLSAITGIYGLSLLTVLAAALPARLGDLGNRRRYAALAAAVMLIALPAGGGAWRLANAPRESVPGVTLRLVQPSIAETIKNDPDALAQSFRRLLALSASRGADKVTTLVWPETAAPPLLERFPDERQAIAKVIPPGGLLLTGAERAEPVTGWPPKHIWNSVVVLDKRGSIIATYDKAHLVPFGEYMPLRSVLPMDAIAPGIGDLSAGPGPRTLTLPGLPPVGPLVCYEAIFPGAVIDRANRPQWLLNVTNDAWYGVSSGPFQHLAIVRVRAVEEGLPLVRAANNGVSAIFDPYGRVARRSDGRVPARLDLDSVGVIDAPLPRALGPTLYERYRDEVFFAAALLILAVAAVLSRTDGRRLEKL
ncbi:MAG TPA: apolipoprotein N-acyltransferase [Stellaceae bacterium]|nr:apolipoprotein N-acyltransferase [Stellaceae bacterium]